MRKREIPLTEEEKKERNKIYTTRYRKSHMKKVSQMNSETQKRMRRERREYKERIDRAIEYIEKEYYSKNTTDIDKVIGGRELVIYRILKGER